MEEANMNMEMLDPGDGGNYEKGSQGEACMVQELSPAQTTIYQDGAPGEACIGEELSPEEAELYNLLSEWDEYNEDELSHDDVESYPEASDWEVCPGQGLSQPQVSISHSLSDGEDYREHELSHRDVGSFQEVSDWEQSIGQELSQEDSIAQKVSRGNGRTPSVQSTWGSDSAHDLLQYGWEENVGDKAWLNEEDESDEISVMELFEDDDGEPRPAGLAGDGFPVLVPLEAWAEDKASEPRPWVLLCAWPPLLQALARRGHTAVHPFQEQEPEADTPSQQRAPRRKRLSRLRRALRGLFRCSCRAPQPQD